MGKGTQLDPMTDDPGDELNKMHRRVNDIIMDTYINICLAQMSAKKGIRKHGYKAIDTILTEFTQLNNKKLLETINPDNLSSE